MENREVEITKEEYDDEDNIDYLLQKYDIVVAAHAHIEKNFDGKKYTLDIFE